MAYFAYHRLPGGQRLSELGEASVGEKGNSHGLAFLPDPPVHEDLATHRLTTSSGDERLYIAFVKRKRHTKIYLHACTVGKGKEMSRSCKLSGSG